MDKQTCQVVHSSTRDGANCASSETWTIDPYQLSCQVRQRGRGYGYLHFLGLKPISSVATPVEYGHEPPLKVIAAIEATDGPEAFGIISLQGYCGQVSVERFSEMSFTCRRKRIGPV